MLCGSSPGCGRAAAVNRQRVAALQVTASSLPSPRRPSPAQTGRQAALKDQAAGSAAVADPPTIAPPPAAAPAAAPAPPTDDGPAPTPPPSTLFPKLALLGCAFLWGSYAPAVRLLYESSSPPDGTVILAVRGTMQGAILFAAAQAGLAAQRQQQEQREQRQPGSTAAAAAAAAEAAAEEERQAGSLLQRWLFLRSPPLWMAALELGLWNYSATALQTVGLQLVGATRASFLVQATVLITPLLSLAAGYRPGKRVWGACAMALAGCLLITADKAEAGAAVATGGFHLGGDGLILASALFYSMAVVRMSGYARSFPSTELAAGKSVVLGAIAVGAMLIAYAASEGGGPSALWGGYADPRSWAILLWAGAGPGALASYLHVQGQKSVAPAEAQVLFSSKPLWAAALAWLVLGGEDIGGLTYAGGATLLAAGLVASSGGGDGGGKPAAAPGKDA